ncbi:MAG: prepilin-type N-terminal cleavage/methylation domain-containing protein, partial [bacterium]
MKYNRKGFTLIELLVVIAIIGLLSTLAVVSLNTARAKARDARRISDVKQIQTALELYYNDKGAYPVRATSSLTLGA